MQRYFVEKELNQFRLKDGDFHHIKNVMRIKSGEQIICIFEHQSFLCTIFYKENDYEIKIIKPISLNVELNKPVILYQALIKNDKFDFIIQKACELGVYDIYPTIFSRSVVKVEKDKIESKLVRYNRIIKEACEQSHREVLATIHPYINIKDIQLDENTLGIVAYEKENIESSFLNVLKSSEDYEKIAIIIGPEGGFSEDEINYLLKHNFKCVSLGKRILRSETAAIYALSVIGFYLEGK